MNGYAANYEYVVSGGVRLFTVALLPNKTGKFPVVVQRSPYVDEFEEIGESEICDRYLNENIRWLNRGYAMVIQHCRGRGKSDGECIPYINERLDTLSLYGWIRTKSFYNGELFLKGASYLSSVHYCASPYAEDIKGAVFGVQDTERYNVCYRNGFFKKALFGEWFVGMYKAKAKIKKNYSSDSFGILPFKDFSKTVFGEEVSSFDSVLRSPKPTDAFWETDEGGVNEREVIEKLKIPALFTTGFYDLYAGGIFNMWKRMSEEHRKNCALLVSPYDHGDSCDERTGYVFENARRTEKFGEDYEIEWFEHIRKNAPLPFEKGKVTYYSIFENGWHSDNFEPTGKCLSLTLGDKAVTYAYDPDNPPSFKGGLSCNFGGGVFQNRPNLRDDIISVYTSALECDTLVKGKMQIRLRVSSDCSDTCFYVRVSIEKERGDFGLRDDITSLCYQLGDYTPDTVVNLSFELDEHVFLIKSGERLRVDIASADAEHYVVHTNQKGLYCEQTKTKIARNTVYLQDSELILPVLGMDKFSEPCGSERKK